MKPFTYKDLAARWDVPAATLRQWKKRGKLPEPDYEFGGSPVWEPKTIEKWEDNHGLDATTTRQV